MIVHIPDLTTLFFSIKSCTLICPHVLGIDTGDVWKGQKLADQTLEEEEAKFIEDQKKILDGRS